MSIDCLALCRLVKACQGLSSLSRLGRASKHVSSILVAVRRTTRSLGVKCSRGAHHRRMIHQHDVLDKFWPKFALLPKRCPNTGTIKALEADNHRFLQLFPISVDLRCQITISRKTKNQESFYSDKYAA